MIATRTKSPSPTLHGKEIRRPEGRFATGWRLAVGLFYVGSAIFNLLVTVPHRQAVYEAFAELAWPGAETLVRSLVIPTAGVFTVAVVVFELTAGLLMLHRGEAARWGTLAAALWLMALIPFLGWYAAANVLLIVALIPLLRREPDRALIDLLSRRFGDQEDWRHRRSGSVLSIGKR